MPTHDVFRSTPGDRHIDALRELDGNECRNIGDGKCLAGDERVAGKLPVEHSEESTQGLLAALHQGGDLGNPPGTPESPRSSNIGSAFRTASEAAT